MIRRSLAFYSLLGVLQIACAQMPGSSPFDAAPPGKTLQGIMDCGSNYEGNEAYDIKVTVLQTARGDKAVKAIVSQDLPPPADGTEYLLARIRFEYNARGRPGDCVHTVKPAHFTALSINGSKYVIPEFSLAVPGMTGPVKSGEMVEGWVIYEVDVQDREPLMTFSVTDGSVAHGGELWFRLYE